MAECYGLTKAILPKIDDIGRTAFENDEALEAIVLRDFNSVGLGLPLSPGTRAFYGTPMASTATGGYFYVPRSMLETFSTGSWRAYYNAGKFRAIEDYPSILD